MKDKIKSGFLLLFLVAVLFAAGFFNLRARDEAELKMAGVSSVEQLHEKKYCAYCGSKITDGIRYCKHCGHMVVQDEIDMNEEALLQYRESHSGVD